MNICPIAEKCGGCTYQGVPYEQQLKEKEGTVRGLLSSVEFDPSLCLPIEPCPDVYRYRNKMDYTFGDEVKDGKPRLPCNQIKAPDDGALAIGKMNAPRIVGPGAVGGRTGISCYRAGQTRD